MGTSASLASSARTLISKATGQPSVVQLSNANVTLTAAQYGVDVIQFTGALTGNVVATLPSQGTWKVYNSTTGAFTVTISNGVGATAVAPQGAVSDVVANSSAGILLTSGGAGASAGVTSFNTRTGAIVLSSTDITGVGGALLANPAFTGAPTAPTPTAGSNSTQIATTAFVGTALGGYAPLANPALTGTPTAPTVSQTGDSSTKIATTAFVQAVLSGIASGINFVGTWNASTNTPTLTSGVGTKGNMYKISVAGTTTLDGHASWNVGDLVVFDGTTWDAIAGQTIQVDSFNTRTGAITLTSTDVTTALGFTPANATAIGSFAPLASPAFTGVPTAPTPTAGNNSTQLATTAFVANYAPLNSPVLTGVPVAPTAVAGTSTTQIATTAFVATSLANYAPLANPAFSGRVSSPAYSYNVVALGNISGTQTLDLSTASEWTATITAATTFAFTNTLAANASEVVYLRLTNAGAFNITWPTSTKFASKTVPAYTASGVDLFGVKYDTTTSTYMVFVVGLNIG